MFFLILLYTSCLADHGYCGKQTLSVTLTCFRCVARPLCSQLLLLFFVFIASRKTHFVLLISECLTFQGNWAKYDWCPFCLGEVYHYFLLGDALPCAAFPAATPPSRFQACALLGMCSKFLFWAGPNRGDWFTLLLTGDHNFPSRVIPQASLMQPNLLAFSPSNFTTPTCFVVTQRDMRRISFH